MSFWDMGGYAAFVWPAYGASGLGVFVAVVWTLYTYRAAKARLKALEEKR
jgi:heme exporter protein CcmD